MKPTPLFKLLFCLLLTMGSLSCTQYIDPPTASVNAPTITSDCLSVTIKTPPATPEDIKTRALGNELARRHETSSINQDILMLKKRIKELDELVLEQKRLIQLYREKDE